MKSTDPTARIKGYLKILKLNRIESTLNEELARAAREATPCAELLERLLALEANALTERQIERRIKEAKLPERKLLADFDFDFQTGVDKRQIMELATLGFAGRRQGVIIAGNSGTGKSHIAKAVAYQATLQGYGVRYVEADSVFALTAWPARLSKPSCSRACWSLNCWCLMICFWPGASQMAPPSCCRR